MSKDVNLVTHMLDDLNLHCTDHAPFAECEACRLQVETHLEALLTAHAEEITRLRQQIAAQEQKP